MGVRKKTFIDVELAFADKQLAEWKAYIEANPFHKIKDYTVGKTVIKKSEQMKSIRETLKDYLSLLVEVERMREVESKKDIEVRGNAEVSSLAEEFLKGRER